ncbi:MAG: hypothetical protein AABZ23_04985 [Deltaproteobacteria bacterium]
MSFFLFVSGCSVKNASGDADEAYIKRLYDWTRSIKVFQDFSTRLYLSATYKTMDFRASYVERYSAAYQADEEARLKLLEKEEEEALKFDDFFVVVYTPEKQWNDLDKKDSIWRLFLEDASGVKSGPAFITRLSRASPLEREFYPHLDEWSVAYEVRFLKQPRAEDGDEPRAIGPVRLKVTGVLGKGELVWDMQGAR